VRSEMAEFFMVSSSGRRPFLFDAADTSSDLISRFPQVGTTGGRLGL
jgi:hypothetical protein